MPADEVITVQSGIDMKPIPNADVPAQESASSLPIQPVETTEKNGRKSGALLYLLVWGLSLNIFLSALDSKCSHWLGVVFWSIYS